MPRRPTRFTPAVASIGIGDLVLEVDGLRTHFFTAEGVVKAVDGIGLSARAGRTLGIVGESGCGKTITALSIMRLLSRPGRTVAGRIIFRGVNLLELSDRAMHEVRGADIAMVFQEPMTALNPVFRVGDQIREVLERHSRLSGSAARRRVLELFDRVRIPDPERRIREYPHQLSGGMRQRAMIAMALACNPVLLIADEPTTAVDVTIQAEILTIIEELKRSENMAVILITHDLSVIAEAADEVSVMYAGKIVESAPVVELFRYPQHPYTQGLLRSLPTPSRVGTRLQAIPGTVPHPLRLPPGCSFAPRCPRRFEPCDSAFPALESTSPTHRVACYLYTDNQDERRGDEPLDIDPTSPLAQEVMG